MPSAPTTPVVYLIPAGFAGWVTIEFAVAGAPALAREGERRLVAVPADGRVRTSSPQELGIVDHAFFSIDAGAARVPIDEPEAHYGADPGAAWMRYDRVVVLAFHTGEATAEDGRHWFERFYVGYGPAGDPPGWP